MNNEQWKDGGDCEQCRRQKYCTKPCRQNKLKQQEDIKFAFANTLAKHLTKEK